MGKVTHVEVQTGIFLSCDHIEKWAFLSALHLQQVDSEQELIRLCSTEPTELKDLPLRVPTDVPRYHIFLYKHSHEGDYLESTGGFCWAAASCCSVVRLLLFYLNSLLCLAVFIYSMPGYCCTVRDRMLYSSCKNNLVEMLENELKIEIEKKVRGSPFWSVAVRRGLAV